MIRHRTQCQPCHPRLLTPSVLFKRGRSRPTVHSAPTRPIIPIYIPLRTGPCDTPDCNHRLDEQVSKTMTPKLQGTSGQMALSGLALPNVDHSPELQFPSQVPLCFFNYLCASNSSVWCNGSLSWYLSSTLLRADSLRGSRVFVCVTTS